MPQSLPAPIDGDPYRYAWNHRGARQKVAIDEAMRAARLHGAYASYEEHLRGSLEIEKLVDLVVLSRDLYQEPAEIAGDDFSRTNYGRRTVGVRVITRPPFMTQRTRRVIAVISASGLPSTATMSA